MQIKINLHHEDLWSIKWVDDRCSAAVRVYHTTDKIWYIINSFTPSPFQPFTSFSLLSHPITTHSSTPTALAAAAPAIHTDALAVDGTCACHPLLPDRKWGWLGHLQRASCWRPWWIGCSWCSPSPLLCLFLVGLDMHHHHHHVTHRFEGIWDYEC